MNILITGGLTGIGNQLAYDYKMQGHKVAIVSFEDRKDIDPKILSDFSYYTADVTNKDATSNAIRSFAEDAGSLDLVIANAGITMDKTTIPDFARGRKVIDVNIVGTLNTFEPAIEIMKEQGSGHLVGISSLSAYNGLPGMAIYGASKSFVMKFCESLALDLKQYGITVTTFAPGFIKTAMTENNRHKMPFMLTREQAAKIMRKAISDKRKVCAFPKPTFLLTSALHHMPRSAYRWVMDKDILGLRK